MQTFRRSLRRVKATEFAAWNRSPSGDDKTNNSSSGHQVFISYGRPDREYVSQLADHLRQSGLSVWFDTRLPLGANGEHIQASIDTCTVVIVVMSGSSQDSRSVNREILYAETLDKPIFPLLLSGTRSSSLMRCTTKTSREAACRPIDSSARCLDWRQPPTRRPGTRRQLAVRRGRGREAPPSLRGAFARCRSGCR